MDSGISIFPIFLARIRIELVVEGKNSDNSLIAEFFPVILFLIQSLLFKRSFAQL